MTDVLDQSEVDALLAWVGGGGRLVACSVPEAEELAVELGQQAGVGAVQDDLPELRERLLHLHGTTSSN